VSCEALFTMDNTASSNIAAVAARLQDRATQLVSEKASLGLTASELSDAQAILDKERRVNATLRKSVLETVVQRHSAELDVMRLEEQKESIEANTQRVQRQLDNASDENELQKEEWDDKARSLYVKHVVDMDVCLRQWEAATKHQQDAKQRKETRLRELTRKSVEAQRHIMGMKERIKDLQRELLAAEEKEEDDDEEAAAMAMQIKATLAKKKSLREALRSVQEELQTVNEAMLEKENECMQLSNNASN
jgi:chromosome segregation ATPase